MIPIWGSGRDLIHAAQTGDGWGIGLNSLFLVWDAFSVVAGALSFGVATAAMMGAKAGVRTALKAAGKVVLSAAKKQGTEFLSKSAKVFKNAGPKIVEFTKGLKCKFLKACFPAGTPVAAKGGYKNIEDIQVGDLVWSWDALTGDIGLKPVIATMENEANTLIKITSGSETIHATPEHPFWVGESIDGAWKNAEDLTLDDELWLLDKRNKSIFSLDLEPQNQPVKVYNFEVAEWHTYFIGMWMMLVHNAGECGVGKVYGILKGEKVFLKDFYLDTFEYIKRVPEELNNLRKAFNYSERKKFLVSISNDADNVKELKKAGLSDEQLKIIENGNVPYGYQVHHKKPLDDGGDNSIENLILIKNDPYHKSITNLQKNLTKGLKPGDSKILDWPMVDGIVYPK